MTKQVSISVEEIKEVFELLEKINDLFHQPLSYRETEIVENFADSNYQEIKKLYYDTVWKWLPEEEQKRYEDR